MHSVPYRGDLNVTSKRLKNWIRNTKFEEANVELVQGSAINYLVVIDFEATCEIDSPAGFQQEIIEFPAVLVNVEKRVIVCTPPLYIILPFSTRGFCKFSMC